MNLQTLSRRLATVIVLFLGLLLAANASAQQAPGGVAVRVVNATNNRALADVTVSITARDGAARTAVTQADGRVQIDGLASGLYELAVRGEGFVTSFEPSIRITARKTIALRIELQPYSPPEGAAAVDEVVVLARAVQADPYGAVSNSYLNREELRSAVGAGSDVMRALDGLPGLVSTGDFANFSVRGRGPRDNLIFVDGMPLDKVVHFDQTLGEEEDIGGGGRFSIFAPNSINGAEFSPGGWSAAFGGRAGSLLQLDVAGGSPTPSATLRVDIAGVELGYEGPSGIYDNTTVFLTARQFDFGRVFEFIDQEDIGQPRLTDFILKTVTELDLNNTIEVLAIAAPENYRRDIDNVLASEDFADVALIRAEQDLGLLGVSWKRLVGDSGEWVNRLYYRGSDKLSSEGEAFPDLVPAGTPAAQIPANERIITINEDERELGWRSDYSTQNRWGSGGLGLRLTQTRADFSTLLREDWTRFIYRSTDPRPPGEDFIVLTPANVNSEFSAQEISFAAYGEQVFEFDNWDLRAGLRYDYDGFADESLLSPRLAANLQLSVNTRLSATAGVFYQSPRFLDRAANSENFQIENERISHFSVGIERDLSERWSLLVESYYQRLNDLVTEAGRADGRATNAGDGRSYGVDMVLSRSFANGWFANATYSFNDVRIDDNDGQGEYDSDFNRPHFFSVGGSWEINERWKIGARWKYASGRPSDDFIINENVLPAGQPLRFSKELTRQNALRLPDYHSLNVRIDYRRPLGPVNLVSFIDVINVYGGPGAGSDEFDPRRGLIVEEDDGAFPILGLIFEKTW